MISLHRIKRSSQNKTEEKEFFHTYTERSVFATDSYVNINPCRQASLTTTLNTPPVCQCRLTNVFLLLLLTDSSMFKDFVFSSLFFI